MLTDEELIKISGGGISGAVIDAIVNLMNSIYNYGRILGSSLKRIVTKNYCK